MAYMFSSKIGRRGRKVVNQPMRIQDLNFTDEFAEMYDEMSKNWQAQARAFRERKEALFQSQSPLKYS